MEIGLRFSTAALMVLVSITAWPRLVQCSFDPLQHMQDAIITDVVRQHGRDIFIAKGIIICCDYTIRPKTQRFYENRFSLICLWVFMFIIKCLMQPSRIPLISYDIKAIKNTNLWQTLIRVRTRSRYLINDQRINTFISRVQLMVRNFLQKAISHVHQANFIASIPIY